MTRAQEDEYPLLSDGFRGDASPRTWLLAIARNRCLDHLGRTKRTPGADDVELDDVSSDEPPPIDLLTRREDTERAMAALGETDRALVVLHFGHGVGYRELADAFAIREGAARMRISRALARMRAAVAPILRSGAAPPAAPASRAHSDLRSRLSAPAPAAPSYEALRDEVPRALRDRLVALAAAV